MKNQNGYTPLTWILIVVVALLIVGVSIAMIFSNTDIVQDITESVQNMNTDTNPNNSTNTNLNIDTNNTDEIRTNIE